MPSPLYFVYNSILVTILILAVFILTPKNNGQAIFALKLLMIMILFGIIGARLFHIIFEEPKYYLESPMRIFYFWQGGFVYYGGFLSAIPAASLFIYYKKENFWKWADFFTVFASLSYAFGRIGCFISGCCYGSYYSFPWGFFRHPTQIYSTIVELLFLFILLKTHKRADQQGTLFLCWIIYHAFGRILIEPLRDDVRGELILGFSISTVISFCLLIIAAAILLYRKQSFRNRR